MFVRGVRCQCAACTNEPLSARSWAWRQNVAYAQPQRGTTRAGVSCFILLVVCEVHTLLCFVPLRTQIPGCLEGRDRALWTGRKCSVAVVIFFYCPVLCLLIRSSGTLDMRAHNGPVAAQPSLSARSVRLVSATLVSSASDCACTTTSSDDSGVFFPPVV